VKTPASVLNDASSFCSQKYLAEFKGGSIAVGAQKWEYKCQSHRDVPSPISPASCVVFALSQVLLESFRLRLLSLPQPASPHALRSRRSLSRVHCPLVSCASVPFRPLSIPLHSIFSLVGLSFLRADDGKAGLLTNNNNQKWQVSTSH
jgi:hypothetical protein